MFITVWKHNSAFHYRPMRIVAVEQHGGGILDETFEDSIMLSRGLGGA